MTLPGGEITDHAVRTCYKSGQVLTFFDEKWRLPLPFELPLYPIVLPCKLLLLLPLFLGLLFCFLMQTGDGI